LEYAKILWLVHFTIEPSALPLRIMGDRSPKETHKKDVQKHSKNDAVAREKRDNAEVQHHPTSGHTATASHPTTSDEPAEPKR
jgi:hypothetical protein